MSFWFSMLPVNLKCISYITLMQQQYKQDLQDKYKQ